MNAQVALPHPFDSDPEIIAMAGDWHGNLDYARLALKFARNRGAEGVIHLGDFGIWPGKPGKLYLDGIAKTLRQLRMWALVVDGNHEDHDQLDALALDEHGTRPLRDRLWHLPRGMRWMWHEKRWLALGGATSLDRKHRIEGVNWWPQESIDYATANRVIDEGPADFMVTHDCASRVDIPGLMPAGFWDPHALAWAHAHQRGLDAIIEHVQPARLWHGHFHVRYHQVVQFNGKDCIVEGLDCDGAPLKDNIQMVSLTKL
jgi:hypothetical protein